MTTPLPHEQRIAELEQRIAFLEGLVFRQERQAGIAPPVQLKRYKTDTDGAYPTGYANTFDLKATDGAWTRTAGDQAITETDRDSVIQVTGHCMNEANAVENTILPGFEILGADGKVYVYLFNYATLWRFTLNEDMGATTADEATADLLDLAGNDTTHDVTVYDRIGMFDSMLNTDAGFCIEQGGEYHVIQAECP